MKTIHKYQLGVDTHHNAVFEVDMPRNAKILSIQNQNGFIVIWAIVNPKKDTRKYTFHVFGTGFEMPDYDKKHYEYISTVQQKGVTNFVWHIFQVHE